MSLNNVVYRGTTWNNVQISYSAQWQEPVIHILGKVTVNLADALYFSGQHFADSGSDVSNWPCIIAIDGCFAQERDAHAFHQNTKPLVSLSSTRIVNPANDEGIELLLRMVRENPHPAFQTFIQEQYSTTYLQGVELYIAERVAPEIRRLKGRVPKAQT